MKLRLTESNLKNIIKEVLLEQYLKYLPEPTEEEEEVLKDYYDWLDGDNCNDDVYVSGSHGKHSYHKYVYEDLCDKYVNKKTDKVIPCFDSEENMGFIIRSNGHFNIADDQGFLMTQQWYNGIGFSFFDYNSSYCCETNIIPVILNGKYNFINLQDGLLSKKWFCEIFDYNDCFIGVVVNKKPYLIDHYGRMYDMEENFIKNAWE